MPSVEVSRESLYELVWAEPMTVVGRRFSVSDVAIIKVCKKLSVPRPPRGYWARKRHGYKVPDRPPLGALKGDAQRVAHVFAAADHVRRVWPKQPSESVEFPVTVRTHAVLVPLKAKLADARPDRYGRIGVEKNICVSERSLPRAVRLLSALFQTLEKRGGTVALVDDRLTVTIRGERVAVEAYEVANRVMVGERTQWGSYQRLDYQPSGNLRLKALAVNFWQVRREWSDGRSGRLEEKLGEITAELEGASSVIAGARADEDARRRRWQRQQLEQRREEALTVLLRARAVKVTRLAANYEQAKQIRALIVAVEGSVNAPAGSRRLVRWARQYADHLDPLLAFRIAELEGESGPVVA
jgi:hypothetical protein